jgi:branched-chain amino acid transport system ATP-binding protein
VRAIDGVSFELASGELLAMIGRMARASPPPSICSTVSYGPTRASVHLAGRNWAWRHRQIWQRSVGAPSIARRFCPLTVENVQMALSSDRQLWSFWRKAADHRDDALALLLEQVGMQSQADRPLRVLAYGDVKRVELAMAIASNLQLPWTSPPPPVMARLSAMS